MDINNLDNIKFIGIGIKGIDIVNKLANNNKEYIKLCAIDIKDTDINENICKLG